MSEEKIIKRCTVEVEVVLEDWREEIKQEDIDDADYLLNNFIADMDYSELNRGDTFIRFTVKEKEGPIVRFTVRKEE